MLVKRVSGFIFMNCAVNGGGKYGYVSRKSVIFAH